VVTVAFQKIFDNVVTVTFQNNFHSEIYQNKHVIKLVNIALEPKETLESVLEFSMKKVASDSLYLWIKFKVGLHHQGVHAKKNQEKEGKKKIRRVKSC
jgi:hypothetical protein